MRPWIATLTTLTCLVPATSLQGQSFRDLLAAAEVDVETLTKVPAESPLDGLDGETQKVIETVLYRLHRLAPRDLERSVATADPSLLNEMPAKYRGEIIELKGRVVRVAAVDPADSGDQPPRLFHCRVHLDDADLAATVWTSNVPAAWSTAKGLHERASFRGVFAGIANDASYGQVLIFLASRVAWHPDADGQVDTTMGRRVLGKFGVDVGLLDEVRHEQPLTHEDRVAFYTMLSAAKRAGAKELQRLARQSLPDYAQPWQGRVFQTKQERLLAATVTAAAAKRQYSVAPLFLDAERQTGQLVALEGVARRAIRIEGATSGPDAAASAAPPDFGHYFELELFTSDSQNLPLVLCVPSLPESFPQGDDIHEPIRVAGFFFKKWRYNSRRPRTSSGGPLRFESASAPLVIGAQPQWLFVESTDYGHWGWIAGGTFIAAAAVVCLIISRWSRGDRSFHRNFSRLRHPSEAVRPPDAN